MKKKIIIGITIFVVLLLGLALYTHYIDSARVRNGVEPKFTIKKVNDNKDNITMTIKEGTLTSATVVIKNNSSEDFSSRRMV